MTPLPDVLPPHSGRCAKHRPETHPIFIRGVGWSTVTLLRST